METERVQLGVALSAPEKLQAIPSPWTEWIIELQKKYVTEDNTLQSNMSWETNRGRPFQALTAFVILAYDPSRQPLPTYPIMTKFLERSDPVTGYDDHGETRSWYLSPIRTSSAKLRWPSRFSSTLCPPIIRTLCRPQASESHLLVSHDHVQP